MKKAVNEGVYKLDKRVLKELRRSKKQVGYLLPVVKDQDGIIISGMHRKAVDPKWPEVSLEIKDELDRIVKTIHYNVQRRPTMKETASRLLRVAKILESRGVKKPDICRALAELIPYSPRHIERLLPNEYKHVEFKPFKPKPLPEGVFDVIYADPPWKYEVDYLVCSPSQHYQTMSTEAICKIHVPSAEDAVLFLWSTNPMLEDALQVMKAWGFKYKSNMVWVKNKSGVGFFFRGQHELLLVGVKGKIGPPEEHARFPSVLFADVREHSEKPDEVYSIIEKMYPGKKYLELFARKRREGWVSWGLEV